MTLLICLGLLAVFGDDLLMAILIIGLLILQALGMLTWWDAGLFMAGIGFVEFLFLAKKY